MPDRTKDKYKTKTVRAGQEDRMKKRGYILMDSDSSGKETGPDHGKRHKRKKIKRTAVYMKPGTPKGDRPMY
tara:strand:+ start:215 stop:430 length:216 start_codon:yes stop_codon:yes gene_type:complete